MPLKIVRVSNGYHLFVNGVPVVADPSGGVSIDREKAGISKGKKSPAPPSDWKPMVFKNAGDVKFMAHKFGRYVLNLGDFVFAYTSLVGIDENRFWK